MNKEKKTGIISKFRINEKDAGSSHVQVALLSEKISHLAEHLKDHKKDNHGRKGLLDMVGKRKRLLKYVERTDKPGYKKLTESLGLK